MKSVRQVALNDISKYAENLREERRHSLLAYEQTTKFYSCFDNWVVSYTQLSSKEVSRLNRVLGLHKINKQRHENI